MNARILSFALALCGGCSAFFGIRPFHRVNQAELTAAQRSILRDVDGYYLTKAKEQAAFASRCEQLSATIVSSKNGDTYVSIGDDDYRFNDVNRASVIDVEGCGQRWMYQVVCAPSNCYGEVRAASDRGSVPA